MDATIQVSNFFFKVVIRYIFPVIFYGGMVEFHQNMHMHYSGSSKWYTLTSYTPVQVQYLTKVKPACG